MPPNERLPKIDEREALRRLQNYQLERTKLETDYQDGIAHVQKLEEEVRRLFPDLVPETAPQLVLVRKQFEAFKKKYPRDTPMGDAQSLCLYLLATLVKKHCEAQKEPWSRNPLFREIDEHAGSGYIALLEKRPVDELERMTDKYLRDLRIKW